MAAAAAPVEPLPVMQLLETVDDDDDEEDEDEEEEEESPACFLPLSVAAALLFFPAALAVALKAKTSLWRASSMSFTTSLLPCRA